jgi:hypothetical protein
VALRLRITLLTAVQTFAIDQKSDQVHLSDNYFDGFYLRTEVVPVG